MHLVTILPLAITFLLFKHLRTYTTLSKNNCGYIYSVLTVHFVKFIFIYVALFLVVYLLLIHYGNQSCDLTYNYAPKFIAKSVIVIFFCSGLKNLMKIHMVVVAEASTVNTQQYLIPRKLIPIVLQLFTTA